MIPAHLQNRTLEQLRATQETIRCFMVKTTGRGYESIIVTEDGQCVGGFNYHRTERIVKRYDLDPVTFEHPKGWLSDEERSPFLPTYCSRCGNHDFSAEALSKVSGSKGRVWERVDTGEQADNLNDFGPGAMWYVTWYNRAQSRCSACKVDLNKDDPSWRWNGDNWEHKCADAHPQCGYFPVEEIELGFFHPHFGNKVYPNPPLCVRTPGGDWVIDSRCTNCALPDDNEHKCWPRQGEPPLVTVDKSFGPTCGAGGGSIVCGDYHGFLRNGYLVKC